MLLLVAAVCSAFSIGPTAGGLIPVQEENGPWKASFALGLEARYGLNGFDLETELLFAELGIEPDSSRGFTYSMVPLSVGAGKRLGFFRYAAGPGIYFVEARKDIAEELEAVWKGTYAGMYLSVGRDFPAGSNLISLRTRAHIINFDGIWVGVMASFLF